MTDTSTTIDGVHRFTPAPIRDERGFFSRTFDVEWCRAAGVETEFVQHNQSRSVRGVLRGLHVRAGPSEAKLVRCASGSIVDFVVDVRPWSPTYRRVERVELDDETMVHLYLPPWVAHGFQVVSSSADICYLHSRPYEPGADLAIAWDDPALGIPWPITPPTLSERDATAPRLDQLDLSSLFDGPR
jgi:dTDP-4-dehydrorhamnose 3,5-epimerase